MRWDQGSFALSLGWLVFCNAWWTARVADLPRWQQQQVRRFPQAVLATGATLRFFAEQGSLGDRLEAAQALRHSGTQAIAPLVRPFFERFSLLSGLPVAACPRWC
ncbi:MAG: hypothetical protein NZ869_01935 [Thermoanaerobaculum sp.]|nr:hypothetical protein [Thermoanaerobaculum sp.]